jgi:hypothetical protein
MISKLSQGTQPVPASMPQSDVENVESTKKDDGSSFIDASQVYGSDLKETTAPQGQRASQVAETKLQAEARAAELHAKIDENSGTKKPEPNSIIAILIG